LGASLTEEEGMASTSSEVTGLLRRWSAGDESARDRLIPRVCDRLRQLAHHRLGGANVERSLNTTALVHDVGGLSLEESAAAMGVSLATAKRELRPARAWLALELRAEPFL